jgi:DNA polymerase-3 subunit beta
MGINPEEHPGMPSPGTNGAKSVTIEIGAGDLGEMIRKTIFAVSSDDTRSNLAGIYLDAAGKKKGGIRMVATDGHRLAMIDRSANGGPISEGVILPRKGLSEVGKIIPEETGTVSLTLAGNEALVQVGDTLLSMRLVEGSYPDYQKVVPSDTPRVVVADRDALLQTLRRVAILSTERSRGVRLLLREGAVQVTANNPDMGEATEELPVDYSGEEFAVGYNAKYLLDVLTVLPEGGTVELGLGDELSPGVVRCNDPGYCYVVMPMRI